MQKNYFRLVCKQKWQIRLDLHMWPIDGSVLHAVNNGYWKCVTSSFQASNKVALKSEELNQ